MNAPTAIALVALALQFATAGMLFFIARAPGWERVRVFGIAALTAGMYSTVDVWAVLRPRPAESLAWVVCVNLTIASMHAAAWVVYTFADDKGRFSSMSRPLQWLTVGSVAVVATMALPGWVVDKTSVYHMHIASLGVDYAQPQFSTLGNIGAFIVISTLLLVLVEHIRRMRRGVPGSLGLVIGFLLFAVCSTEEALVTAGVFNFIFLGDIGYLCVVIPVTVQLVRRFSEDASRLALLSASLQTEVETRTVERDAAREALVEQERLAALGRLAAGVGHEVNNPLQYLLANLEEVRDVVGSNHAAALELPLARAFEGADRIRDVVQGLRTYASPGSGLAHAIDVRDVVTTAVRIATPQIRHLANVEVLFGTTPLVFGEEGKLVQALLNPLVNAAQALGRDPDPRPGSIVISTRTTASGEAEVVIRDSGPGFDPSVLPRLGEPYVTTRADEGGTGLGLFVTRGLLLAVGGDVTLSNAAEGGAVVSIRLPAAPREADVAIVDIYSDVNGHAPTPRSLPSAEPPDSRPQVLLVDDEMAIREALVRGLSRLDFDVTAVADGHEALDRIDLQSFDVVVSDLMMPNLSGMDLAERLSTRDPRLRGRFVAMSGGATTAEADAFLRRDDVVALEKPVELSRLAETIRAVITRGDAHGSR